MPGRERFAEGHLVEYSEGESGDTPFAGWECSCGTSGASYGYDLENRRRAAIQFHLDEVAKQSG